MTREFRYVIRIYFVVLLVVFSTLLSFALIMFFYEGNTSWAEKAIEKLLSIIELIVGAAIGSLSTAIAYTFSSDSKKEVKNEKTP